VVRAHKQSTFNGYQDGESDEISEASDGSPEEARPARRAKAAARPVVQRNKRPPQVVELVEDAELPEGLEVTPELQEVLDEVLARSEAFS
jgi:hypothetical protein